MMRVTIIVEQDDLTYTMYLPEVVSLERVPIVKEGKDIWVAPEMFMTHPDEVVGFKVAVESAYSEDYHCSMFEWIGLHAPDQMRAWAVEVKL